MKKLSAIYVGCDVGDRTSELCILDHTGAVLERQNVKTTAKSLTRCLSRFGGATVAIEAGTHSRWIEEVLTAAGHGVIVANPRQVRLIWKRGKKTDRADALLLARLARVDQSLLAPVHHRSRTAQLDLAAIRSRDILVRTRTRLFNHVRGTLKPFGIKPVHCSTTAFPDRVADEIPAELAPALEPILKVLRELNDQIAAHDRQVDAMTAANPVATHLATVYGVGALTALTFRLTIEDPTKFKQSRVVAAFLGLTPAKDQSGQSDPQRHISKAGDPLTRRLLVQCAHHMLGHTGADCDIRRWGLHLAERGGKDGRKRAIVAVARKLAVVLHRIWVTGQPYRPFRDAPAMA